MSIYLSADIGKSVRAQIEAISKCSLTSAEATVNTVSRTAKACQEVLSLYTRSRYPAVPLRASFRNQEIADQVTLLHRHFACLVRYYGRPECTADVAYKEVFNKEAQRAYEALNIYFKI